MSATIREFGFFLNTGRDGQPDGVDIGLPVRFEKVPRYFLGNIPCWPFNTRLFQTQKAIYAVKVDPVHPLGFVCGEIFYTIGIRPGTVLRIASEESDMGSVPVCLQPLVPKDSYLPGFLFHDYGYASGSVFEAVPKAIDAAPEDADFKRRAMTRFEVDKMLYMMVRADGGSELEAEFIWNAVNLGGWSTWREYRRTRGV